MEARTELASEVDTGQDDEKIVEFGEISRETQGSVVGFEYEFPGRYW